MKKIICILTGAAAVLLAGCVSSVYPYFNARDVVAEPALLGEWTVDTNKPETEIWKFEQREDLDYRYSVIKSDATNVLTVHAFKLDGQLLLDGCSQAQDYNMIPTHYLAKVIQTTPTLRLSLFNYDWLNDLVATNPGAIRHHMAQGDKPSDTLVVLTADTAELQKFVHDNLNTEAAWSKNPDLYRMTPGKK